MEFSEPISLRLLKKLMFELTDNFELILKNIEEITKYIKKTGSNCQISTYHLITDNSQLKFEVDEYKKNIVSKTNTLAYIWTI